MCKDLPRIEDSAQESQGAMAIGPNGEHKDRKTGFLWSCFIAGNFFFFPPFEMGSYYTAQNGLELKPFLPQPPE